MLNQFDYVRLTLSDNTQREGYLVALTGNVGTLAGLNSNTAFTVSSTLIEVLIPGSNPVFLPAQVESTSKPYRVAALVGAHTAMEDYFSDQAIAKRFALAQVGAWTNNVPDREFHQFTCILVLTTSPRVCERCGQEKPLQNVSLARQLASTTVSLPAPTTTTPNFMACLHPGDFIVSPYGKRFSSARFNGVYYDSMQVWDDNPFLDNRDFRLRFEQGELGVYVRREEQSR